MWYACGGGHDIQAIPEAVNEVDIGMACLTKHDFGTRGASLGRVCGEIFGTHVRFGLDDAADAHRTCVIVDEVHADEVTRDGERTWLVEIAG